jgi:AcrR family transcriptional regulator
MSEVTGIKKKIIDAAVAIIQEQQEIGGVSIRAIAKRAKIGIGLINYHFQTKENLLRIAVRQFISDIISQWPKVVPRKENKAPKDHLLAMLQATADFLASYPRISRLSILNDLNNPSNNDNTMDTLKGMLPIMAEIDEGFDDKKYRFRILQSLANLQWIFIRHELVKTESGFDFFDPVQRRKFIAGLVDSVFVKRF